MAIASAVASRLDDLFRDVTSAVACAHISDEEASCLYAAIYARRREGPAAKAAPRRLHGRTGTIFPSKRYQRSPDREASIRRRRSSASSGAMPPAIAALFSEGERAVLSVVVLEIRTNGVCGLCNDAIAARAGVCLTTAKNALRLAGRLGLILIERRPQKGRKNLPNLVSIVSAEWLVWIEKEKRSGSSIGVKPLSPTNSSISRREERRLGKRFAPFAGRQGSNELRGKTEQPPGTSDGIAWRTNTAMYRE
ncbi:hypothetical protein [Aureimonas ureilytica]|uniref:hypothetical protein n=1 Tax=Aureimonas ureilytica TaxID=401562 RepID=UPI00128F9242|nr:hypothetical protein [Aureimonas ureilytica]